MKYSIKLHITDADTTRDGWRWPTQYATEEEARKMGTLMRAGPTLYAALENIANAHPDLWDDPTEFRAWAQNRAHHAMRKALKVARSFAPPPSNEVKGINYYG